MFVVISIMILGIAVGYVLKRVEFFQKIGTTISWTIYLLLFLLGVTVGANDSIVKNLYNLGWQAAVLAIAGTLGSIVFAWLVYRYVFKERSQR